MPKHYTPDETTLYAMHKLNQEGLGSLDVDEIRAVRFALDLDQLIDNPIGAAELAISQLWQHAYQHGGRPNAWTALLRTTSLHDLAEDLPEAYAPLNERETRRLWPALRAWAAFPGEVREYVSLIVSAQQRAGI